MKFLNLFGLLLITSCPLFSATEESVLTLADVEGAAVKHSEELSIAELHTVIAREKINQIRGINLPKLTANGAYNIRNTHPGFVRKNPNYHQNTPEGMHQPPPQPKKIVAIAAEKEGVTGKISLLVPIYDFGYESNLMQAQESLVEASIHDKDRVLQDLLFLVSTTFYRALEASKIETVAKESISILEKQLTTAKDLYSVGLVTKNDALAVEVQLAERQQQLIEVHHIIESALTTLHRLTGISSITISQLQDVHEPREWDVDVEEMITKADKVHPVLKKIVTEREAASFDVAATRAENYPDINAFLNLNASSDKYLLHKKWAHGGVEIEIPIFDGGIVASKVAQKRTEISVIDRHYDKAVEDIHLHIRKSFLQVDSAFHRLSVARKSIQLAEDNLTISQDLFEEGQILSDDVLDNEGRLAQARSNYCQALYEFYMAKSELEYAAGLIQL
jgi:outer membrane protein